MTKKRSVWSLSFILVFAAFSILMLTNKMVDTFLPLYVDKLGGSPFLIGILPTVYSLANFAVRPFTGVMADRKGRYFSLLLGMGLLVFSGALYLVSASIAMILVAKVFAGFCNSITGTTLATMTSDVLPEDKLTDGIGYVNLSTTISMALGPMIILGIYGRTTERMTLVILFGCAVITFLFAMTLKKTCIQIETERQEKYAEEVARVKNEKITLKFLLKNMFGTDAWKPSCLTILTHLVSGGVSSFLALLASERGIDGIATYYTVEAITMALARFCVGKITRKIGVRRLLATFVLLNGCCVVGIGLSKTLFPLLVCAAVGGFVKGCISPQINSLAVLSAPGSQRGMANATHFFFNDISISTCGIVVGAVAQFFGKSAVFFFGGAVAVIASVCIVVFHKFFIPERAEKILMGETVSEAE